MKHVAVDEYWLLFDTLSTATRKLVEHNFSVIKQYPNHPLLRLKKIDADIRVGRNLSPEFSSMDEAIAYLNK